jgi:hypothetical protein
MEAASYDLVPNDSSSAKIFENILDEECGSFRSSLQIMLTIDMRDAKPWAVSGGPL